MDGESLAAARGRRDDGGERLLHDGGTLLLLVPLDGSVEAKAALPTARLIAVIMGAGIQVVHATERPLPSEELLQRVGLRREETQGIVVEQVLGSPADAVVRLAEERRAMLITMTTRGRTPIMDSAIRPVTAEIVRRMPCPVLLVRPDVGDRAAAAGRLRRIILPLDGAPSSANVIGPVLDLAERAQAEIDILYVATQAERPRERGSLTVPTYIDQPQYEWPTWAHEFAARFASALGRRATRTIARVFLRTGEPASEILRFATERDGDMIALEWKCRMESAHGRVVQAVLREARCPVLLLRVCEPR